jgi:hypothetical protein
VTIGTGGAAEFTLTLTQASPANLIVTYALKGSADNGRDHQRLPVLVKIKAGKTKANIKIVPRGTRWCARQDGDVHPGIRQGLHDQASKPVKITIPAPPLSWSLGESNP